MLDVGNGCYVAVCSASEFASARTRGGEGRGHTVAAARLQPVATAMTVGDSVLIAGSETVLICKLNWRRVGLAAVVLV